MFYIVIVGESYGKSCIFNIYLKLVEAKEYSYEKALEILVETETEKKEVLKRIKEMKQ